MRSKTKSIEKEKLVNSKIHLIESIFWLIVIVSFVSVITLLMSVFKPALVLIGSFVIFLIGVFLLKKEIDFSFEKKLFLPVLLLIAVSLFFRIDQEQYIMGGQDEGLYVNMSKYFENHGQVFPKDDFRASLSNELKALYDKNNVRLETREHIKVDGEYEGLFLLGVFVKDIQNSEYVFQFYHLHPIWMAITGDVLGEGKRQYSLLFFALLSVVFFYLIIHKITQNGFYAFGGAFLIAVSPLHAYFTKFPVTEVMALCFSLAGLYFLLLYYKSVEDNGEKINRYLVLSALIFGAMFFIRIHGFMYIPFFYALFLLTIVSTISIKKELIFYFLGIFAIFALSVWYGFIYSYPYVTYIYRFSFSRALGENWKQVIFGLIVAMAILPFVLAKISYLKKVSLKLKDYLLKYFYVLFLLVLAVGAYKIYQLGFTEKYIGHPWLDSRWHIAGDVAKALLHSSLVVLIEHISIVLFIIFLFALKFYDRKNIYLNVLVLFVFGFWVYALLLQWTVPYQYYYARYLLSELIPYIFLFTVIFMATMSKQIIVKTLLVVSVIYFVSLTSLQLKGTESKGAYESLNKVSQIVSKDDLLLLSHDYPMAIKTTLKYYYDLNVWSFKSENIVEILDKYLIENKSDIYLLTEAKISYDGFSEIKTITFNLETSNNTKHHSPFIKYFDITKAYTLYKFNKTNYIKKKMHDNGVIYRRNEPLGKLQNFNGDTTWTKENSKITDLNFNTQNYSVLQLSTHGWNPNRANLEKLNLQLKANGVKLEFLKYKDNDYYFKLPKDIKVIEDIEISSNTFNPKQMGMNNDSRDLGIDIKEINLLKELPK